MREFDVQRRIDAPPDRIWNVLTNARQLASGPFGIIRLEGEIAVGGRLRLWSSVSPNRAFPLTVVSLEKNRTMVWRGGMPFGLFIGTRSFTLVPNGAGTQFRMREVYEGPMAALIWRSMPDLGPSFAMFADALAKAVEA